LGEFKYEMLNVDDVKVDDRADWVKKGSVYGRTSEERGGIVRRVEYVKGAPGPQPYDQLALVYRAAGRDELARVVRLRSMQHAEAYRRSREGKTGRGVRYSLGRFGKTIWNFLQNLIIGYGYRPGRAFSILLGLWGVGVLLFWFWPPDPTKGRMKMTFSEHLAYPLDLLVPVIGLGEKDRWHPHGQLLDGVASFLVVAGWVLGAVVVAAVARTLRRE
jgi:hypothetical protein